MLHFSQGRYWKRRTRYPFGPFPGQGRIDNPRPNPLLTSVDSLRVELLKNTEVLWCGCGLWTKDRYRSGRYGSASYGTEEADAISAMLLNTVDESVDTDGTPLRFQARSGSHQTCICGQLCGDVDTKNGLVEAVRRMKLGVTELQRHLIFQKFQSP